jgi:hypothetical protein
VTSQQVSLCIGVESESGVKGDECGIMLVAAMCYLVKPDEKNVGTRVGNG